jgi:hypothetical protein
VGAFVAIGWIVSRITGTQNRKYLIKMFSTIKKYPSRDTVLLRTDRVNYLFLVDVYISVGNQGSGVAYGMEQNC